jgi:hypothetical protein
MIRQYQLILFLIINLFFHTNCRADSYVSKSDTIQDTTLSKTSNTLDSALILKLSKQPEFQYQKKTKSDSFFTELKAKITQSFYRFLSKIFESLFGVKVSKNTSAIIFWILFAVLIGFLVFLFLRTKRHLFTTSGSSVIDASSIEIENISYFDKINLAREEEDYKSGIRFILLHTIQQLSDEETIKYIPGKTLFEYQYDIKNSDQRKLFIDICYFYEYVWFGNFPSTQTIFDNMYQKMNDLLSTQKSKR